MRLLPGGVGVEVEVAGQVRAATAVLGAAGVVEDSLAVRHTHTGPYSWYWLAAVRRMHAPLAWRGSGCFMECFELPNPGVLCMPCNPAVRAVHRHLPSRLSRCRRTLWSARCRWAYCSAAAWPLTRRCRVSAAHCGAAVVSWAADGCKL